MKMVNEPVKQIKTQTMSHVIDQVGDQVWNQSYDKLYMTIYGLIWRQIVVWEEWNFLNIETPYHSTD